MSPRAPLALGSALSGCRGGECEEAPPHCSEDAAELLARVDALEPCRDAPRNVLPPEGYLLPYWMGRFYGLIAPDQ